MNHLLISLIKKTCLTVYIVLIFIKNRLQHIDFNYLSKKNLQGRSIYLMILGNFGGTFFHAVRFFQIAFSK